MTSPFSNIFILIFSVCISPENEFKYQNEYLFFDNNFVNDYNCYLIFRRDRDFEVVTSGGFWVAIRGYSLQ